MSKPFLLTCGVIVLALACTSCSEFERVSCSVDEQCRLAIGYGSTCISDGYCSSAGVRQKAEEAIPEACAPSASTNNIYPEEIARTPTAFESVATIGIIVRSGSTAAARGAQLAIEEFADSAEDFALSVAGVPCTIDDTDEIEEVARYLVDGLGAKVLIVIGPQRDVNIVRQLPASAFQSGEAPLIFGTAVLADSIVGTNVLSTLPGQLDEIDAIADVLVERTTEEDFRIEAITNPQAFSTSSVEGRVDSTFRSAEFEDATEDDRADYARREVDCDCDSTCDVGTMQTEIARAVDEADQAGESLHLVVFPRCAAAATQFVNGLVNHVRDGNLTQLQETLKSVIMSGEAYELPVYGPLSSRTEFEELRGILLGVVAAPNPESGAYQELVESYQDQFATVNALSDTNLLAHAADSAWMSILGYASAFVDTNSVSSISPDDVRERIVRLLDQDACPGTGSDQEICNLRFPRTSAAWNSLRTALSNRITPLSAQLEGASGPLLFSESNGQLFLSAGYFTTYQVTNPEDGCLAPVQPGDSLTGGLFYCPVVPTDGAEYTLYPIAAE